VIGAVGSVYVAAFVCDRLTRQCGAVKDVVGVSRSLHADEQLLVAPGRTLQLSSCCCHDPAQTEVVMARKISKVLR
jgi:hypothetical protein